MSFLNSNMPQFIPDGGMVPYGQDPLKELAEREKKRQLLMELEKIKSLPLSEIAQYGGSPASPIAQIAMQQQADNKRLQQQAYQNGVQNDVRKMDLNHDMRMQGIQARNTSTGFGANQTPEFLEALATDTAAIRRNDPMFNKRIDPSSPYRSMADLNKIYAAQLAEKAKAKADYQAELQAAVERKKQYQADVVAGNTGPGIGMPAVGRTPMAEEKLRQVRENARLEREDSRIRKQEQVVERFTKMAMSDDPREAAYGRQQLKRRGVAEPEPTDVQEITRLTRLYPNANPSQIIDIVARNKMQKQQLGMEKEENEFNRGIKQQQMAMTERSILNDESLTDIQKQKMLNDLEISKQETGIRTSENAVRTAQTRAALIEQLQEATTTYNQLRNRGLDQEANDAFKNVEMIRRELDSVGGNMAPRADTGGTPATPVSQTTEEPRGVGANASRQLMDFSNMAVKLNRTLGPFFGTDYVNNPEITDQQIYQQYISADPTEIAKMIKDSPHELTQEEDEALTEIWAMRRAMQGEEFDPDNELAKVLGIVDDKGLPTVRKPNDEIADAEMRKRLKLGDRPKFDYWNDAGTMLNGLGF